MSRWLEREEKPEESGGSLVDSLSRGGADKRERAATAGEEKTDFGENLRERVLVNNREYSIRRSERETLFELGRFRVVYESDLLRGVYAGNKELGHADLRALGEQHLIYTVSFVAGRSGREKIYTLSASGRTVAERVDPRVEGHSQHLYSGFVKPSEIEHDALLYRAFLSEETCLRSEGRSVRRVVVDYELKQKLFSKIERARGRRPYRDIKAESARELGLPVVGGRVMLPDLRIEFEDERGLEGRVDIEVATGNYRESHIQAKLSAGFRVYGSPSLSADGGPRLKGRLREERSEVLWL